MAVTNSVVIQENWETYSYRLESGLVFVSFCAGSGRIPREEFPFCARVIIPIKQPNQNGGPTGEEAETLWRLEDVLVDALTQHGAKCILLARLTHSAKRELVFQVADWSKFRPPVGRWIRDTSEYDINVSEHDGWEFFDNFVWPSAEDWMLIQDRRVVDGLIRAGSDPHKEHSLEFVFRGEQMQLQKLNQELERRGYHTNGASTPSGQLVLVKNLPLNLDQIWQESVENQRLCGELGIEFDGWGAAVVK